MDQTPLGTDRARTKWTPTMDRCFIDIMMEQVQGGNKIHNTFRKKAWVEMVTLFNEKSGLQLDKEVLRNRSKKLRMQFSAVKTLLDHDGFNWDDTRKMVTAETDIWDCYLKAHPEAQTYKTKTIPNYLDLCMIYGNETVNGRSNTLISNLSFTEDITRIETDGGYGGMHSPSMAGFEEKHSFVRYSEFEGIDNLTPISNGRSRTTWTPTMDRYFIGIMVDQVHKGNKNGNVFRKKAWRQMVFAFNTQFRLQLDKEVLRNRAKKLRIQYIAMKVLLNKPEFHWDESRQMIAADDKVWDTYLKAHPGQRSYRTKTLPNYNHLCVIYGNEPSNGRYNQLENNSNFYVGNPEVAKDGISGSSHSPATSYTNEDLGVVTENVVVDHQATPNFDCSKTNWTPPMDNYFIEIMIEHVQKGHKIGKTFHREAWSLMLELFNTKFGSQLDKEVLKNRYKKLRTQYNAMDVLLSNDGFCWDETRQLVIADDTVWDNYLKDHPEMRSFRTKIAPNYNSLSLIFGDSSIDHRYCNSGQGMNSRSISVGVFGTPHSPLVSPSGDDLPNEDMQDEDSSDSDGSMDKFNHGSKKRPFQTPLTSQQSRKSLRGDTNGMLDALREMASAITMLANKKKENENAPLEQVVNELKAIPDLDDDLLLEACDLLEEDERKAKMFLALDASIRKKWLMRKLRP